MSEYALLKGLRDQLLVNISALNGSVANCSVEYDAMAPATSGNTYVAVIPGGCSAGPRSSTNLKVLDEIYRVEIAVAVRAVRKPRDRTRDLFLSNTVGLEAVCEDIVAFVNGNYDDVLIAVNALITGTTYKFIEPLRFIEKSRISIVGSEYWGDKAGEDRGGLLRRLTFDGARRIRTLT